MKEGWLIDLGTVPYGYTADLQRKLAVLRFRQEIPDVILLVEHPPVVTIGNNGSLTNLNRSVELLKLCGIELHQSDRGGDVTYHAPGQLVIYPILDLTHHGKDLHLYVRHLEEVGIRAAADFGINAHRRVGLPGVWVGENKLASIGLASHRWITRHGMAVNVNNNLGDFAMINPCGLSSSLMTSFSTLAGQEIEIRQTAAALARHLGEIFSLDLQPAGLPARGLGKPPWLRSRITSGDTGGKTQAVLDRMKLNTVCREANCPNALDCFSRGSATFLIMGARCTRQCRFCGVQKSSPEPLDALEPEQVAIAACHLELKHVVITSVTRDDLPDGGARHFSDTIKALRAALPRALIEVLIPDFQGSRRSLDVVLEAGPDILAHNLETVPRLYKAFRPGADYRRSLSLLRHAARHRPRIEVKSGIMLGVGERLDEVGWLMEELVATGCETITLGQYLSPEPEAFPIYEYITPPLFDEYRIMAEKVGFKSVSAGPLVRSSYARAA